MNTSPLLPAVEAFRQWLMDKFGPVATVRRPGCSGPPEMPDARFIAGLDFGDCDFVVEAIAVELDADEIQVPVARRDNASFGLEDQLYAAYTFTCLDGEFQTVHIHARDYIIVMTPGS